MILTNLNHRPRFHGDLQHRHAAKEAAAVGQALQDAHPTQPGKRPRFGFWFSCQWIGLRENLQESPIFNGKIYGFL